MSPGTFGFTKAKKDTSDEDKKDVCETFFKKDIATLSKASSSYGKPPYDFKIYFYFEINSIISFKLFLYFLLIKNIMASDWKN